MLPTNSEKSHGAVHIVPMFEWRRKLSTGIVKIFSPGSVAQLYKLMWQQRRIGRFPFWTRTPKLTRINHINRKKMSIPRRIYFISVQKAHPIYLDDLDIFSRI
jgi:hypothetical protein